jgi:hypothetical protein
MRSTSPFPAALLVTAGLLVVAQLVALVIALRRQRGAPEDTVRRWTWIVSALCFGTPLVVLLLMVLGVHDGRAQTTELSAIARDPSDARLLSLPADACFGLCVGGLQKILGGLVLAATGLFGAAVTVFCWWRSARPPAVKRAVALAAAGLALCAVSYGGGLAAAEQSMRKKLSDVAVILPEEKPRYFALVLEETRPLTRGATWFAVGAAALAALGCALALSRGDAPQPVGSGAVALGVAVLVIGVLSFAATRGHASDLAGAWPGCPGGACRSVLAISRDIELPRRLTHAAPLRRAPVLAVTRPEHDPAGGVVTLDGSEVAVTRELTGDEYYRASPWSTLPKLLELLAERTRMQRELAPDRAPPGEIVLQADRGLKAPALRPLLATCHRAGYRTLLVATTFTDRFESAVLGELTTTREAGLPVRLTVGQGAANLVQLRHESFGTLTYRLDQAAGRGPVALRVEVAD